MYFHADATAIPRQN